LRASRHSGPLVRHGEAIGLLGLRVELLPFIEAIITTTPNALCATMHNRIPVILDAADWQTWIGETPADCDARQALLRPPAAAASTSLRKRSTSSRHFLGSACAKHR